MRRISDAVMVAPAVAFGLVTWSVAHALTFLLFVHIHADPVPTIHWHDGPGPVAVAVAALVLTAALAGRAVRRGAAVLAPASTGKVRIEPGSAATIAPAVFVVVEFVQYFASGGEGPPVTLLVIGVVLHSAVGAVTPMLWTAFVHDTIVAVLAACTADESDDERASVSAADRAWADSRPAVPFGSRGPPARGFPFVPCPG